MSALLTRRVTPGDLQFLLNPERVRQRHRATIVLAVCSVWSIQPFQGSNLCGDGIDVGGPNPACYAGLSYLTPSAWRGLIESVERLIRN
jgi:hypothetical protein